MCRIYIVSRSNSDQSPDAEVEQNYGFFLERTDARRVYLEQVALLKLLDLNPDNVCYNTISLVSAEIGKVPAVFCYEEEYVREI